MHTRAHCERGQAGNIVRFPKCFQQNSRGRQFLDSVMSLRIRIPEIVFLLAAFALPGLTQKAPDKPSADALYKQGLRSVQKGDLVGARTAFEKVVRLEPNSPEGHNSLGWVL